MEAEKKSKKTLFFIIGALIVVVLICGVIYFKNKKFLATVPKDPFMLNPSKTPIGQVDTSNFGLREK